MKRDEHVWYSEEKVRQKKNGFFKVKKIIFIERKTAFCYDAIGNFIELDTPSFYLFKSKCKNEAKKKNPHRCKYGNNINNTRLYEFGIIDFYMNYLNFNSFEIINL